MSYTNIDLVRRLVGLSENRAATFRNYPLVFGDQAEVRLPGAGIVKGSVAVKRVIETAPRYQEVTVSSEPVSLNHPRIVPGSVTAASDSSLGNIYTIDVDYAVAYEAGIFSRIPGGAIDAGQNVSVWYYFHSLYSEGIDYAIDYDSAVIRRLAGGGIVAGQSLLIDYDTPYQYLSYEILNEAVLEANAMIEKEVDPQKMFGADLSLQTAATCLAAAILCRAAAAEDLRSKGNAAKNVSSWLALAESYRSDYERLIKIFRPGRSRMSGPRNS